jgi:hypothetical protein
LPLDFYEFAMHTLKLDPISFVDRDGNLNLTFEACLRLAQAFARAEPDTQSRSLLGEPIKFLEHSYQSL